MSDALKLIKYDSSFERKWDNFIGNSANGTFLQTRNFLNYHNSDKFEDCSLMIVKGDELVAVIPANIVQTNGQRRFISHQGSTFGGLIIKENGFKINLLEEIFDLLDKFFTSNGFSSISFKQTGRIFCAKNTDLLDYFFYYKGYQTGYEVGYYIDFSSFNSDVLSNLSSSRRRDYKYSLKNNLTFKELYEINEITEFYSVLEDNYKKFNKAPVHSIDDLIDFKKNRLTDIVKFYGVYLNDKMIAGSMVFCFNGVFHTQYLAVLGQFSDLFANEFLYVSLIEEAMKNKYKYFSFGTSTLDNGHVLNSNLARFKEGFGTSQYNNKTFSKKYS